MRLAELAERLQAVIEGDGAVEVTGLAALSEAGEGDLSFLANPRYASEVATTDASAVLVNADWRGASAAAILRVANADRAFAAAAELLAPPAIAFAPGVHAAAVVADSARLGADVHIGPGCVVADDAVIDERCVLMAGCYVGHRSRIGADAGLYPNVVVREDVRVGARVRLHAGCVIGCDGFGYVREDGQWRKIPQIGGVVLEDDVEIGANVTIDRARFGETVVSRGSKIDNLVQLAHNVHVGANTAIAAQVGISGSTRIGAGVRLGGQAGLAGHLQVGDGATVGAQAGVTKDVEAGTFVSGYPAMPHSAARRQHAHIMRIPAMKKRIKELEERIAALERAADGSAES